MSSPLDNSQAHLAEARAFARSLNILLKYARIYGLDHARTLSQMDAAWSELTLVLSRIGHPGLLLGVAGEDLIIDGEPVGTGVAERNFAQLLATAKVASLQFSPDTTFAAFTRFAFALISTPAPEGLGPALKACLAGQSAIRVNEVRFVSSENTPVPRLAEDIIAENAQKYHRRAQEWLYDPEKLLELISAAEASGTGGLRLLPADALDDIESERDLVAVIRVLAQLGESANMPGGARAGDVLPTLPPGMRAALHHAAARLVRAPHRRDEPLLVQLAEQLVIRFALQSFERGEMAILSAAGLLRRSAREISDLHRVLTLNDPRAPRSAPPSFPELLERQFWTALPEMPKRRVLFSEQAWCVPAREVGAAVEQSLARHDVDSARKVLRRFSLCVTSPDADGRLHAALGLVELAPVIGKVDPRLLGTAIRDVTWQLRREPEAEVRSQLATCFVRLSQEAANFHRYGAFEQALEMLERVERALPELGAVLRPQVAAPDRIPDFLETALRGREVPSGLVRVLRRMPEPTARCIGQRFSRAARAMERERLVDLTFELGASAATRLCRQLQYGPAAEAVLAVGLLARLAPELLENVLPGLVRGWGSPYHAAVIAQLAASGARHRGRLLLSLLEVLDPLALPEAIDEIGMSGEVAAAPRLMDFAFATPGESVSPYVQVKAIEALGRLRVVEAAEPLKQIVRERSVFRWIYPGEMRAAAAEALAAIDADAARALPAARVLAMAAMALPTGNEEWARQRRYVRVMPRKNFRGVASGRSVSTTLDITSLSLSGGLATTDRPAKEYRHATLEIPLGMRKVKAEVVVHDRGPRQVSFEIVNMNLDDRNRLRKFLAGQIAS